MLFFRELYQTANPLEFSKVLEQCDQIVIEDMNRTLLADMDLKEVKNIVFQLGASKAPESDGLSGFFFQKY